MLTICVVVTTFSMSCGLVGSMSLGIGSCWPSPGFVSLGRLFFFSLELGGRRLDCDHPVLTLAPSSNNESATAKNGYERLILINFDSEGHKRGRMTACLLGRL